jgi:site-specific DNA-methyltransferase (adenine-specific)
MCIKNPFDFNKVYPLDAIVGMDNLPERFADIVIMDPPYNIGKDFGNNVYQLEIEEYVSWARRWIDAASRILKSSGTVYIYGFSEILAHLFVEINLPRRWLVWHYTNKNSATNKFWQRSHESIIAFWRDDYNRPDRIFNLDDVREPYTETFLANAAGKKRANTEGRFSHKGKSDTIYAAHPQGALPRDVIKVPALAGGAGRTERFFYCKDCNDLFALKDRKLHKTHETITHPTQKPFDLNTKLLKASKPEKDGVVVIPFAGTGSELYAAKMLEMKAIGFDINRDFVDMANLLIQQGYPQKKSGK